MQIAVTGASGFIGAEIVRVLLDRGHTVHGTVRDLNNDQKTEPLKALGGAQDRLLLFEANLLDEASFDEAFDGCDIVMHVASPYVIDVEDAQRDLVDPAVQGPRAVMLAAARCGVRRVVLTSSSAAITDEPEDRIYTEEDWNSKSSLSRNPYSYSKTLAERSAWDFVDAESPSFDLVVINPVGVIGPSVTSGVNTTSRVIMDLLNGGVYPAIIDMAFPLVDVRDVAEAHVRAAESPDASGRYICANEIVPIERTVAVLRNNGFDGYKLPRMKMTSSAGSFIVKQAARFQPHGSRSFIETNLGRRLNLDTSKIVDELGIEFGDIDQSIVDTANDLIQWGHVKPRA
ncbi:MAG: SDR family oxidoreductase [Acidimicrobiia bacterium]